MVEMETIRIENGISWCLRLRVASHRQPLRNRRVPRAEIEKRVGEVAKMLDLLPVLKRRARGLTADVKQGNNELPVVRIPAISKPPQASEGVPGRN